MPMPMPMHADANHRLLICGDASALLFLLVVSRLQVGPEFDIEVPPWTGPTEGKLTPPAHERDVSRQSSPPC